MADVTPTNGGWEARARVVDPYLGFQTKELAPWAEDWCFVTGWGRTGTMAFARMLSEHPDVAITVEDGVPHLLYSALTAGVFQVDGEDGVTVKWAHSQWTLAQLRELIDTWRKLRCGDARVVGDKLWMYWVSRDRVRELFPACKFVYCYRHPLDQISSFVALGADWLAPTGTTASIGAFLDALRRQADDVEEARDADDVIPVPFENLAQARSRLAIVETVWKCLGVEVDAKPLARVGSAAYDGKPGAIGRWRRCDAIAKHLGALTSSQLDAVLFALDRMGYDADGATLQSLHATAQRGRSL